jgi:hypothetical protein
MFAAIFVAGPVGAFGQQDRVQDLERRVAQLERLVLQLTQRIAALESKIDGRRGKAPSIVSNGNWREKSNWRRLRRGMAMEEVAQLLGEPEKVNAGSTLTFWYWGYPSGGDVQFETSSGRVHGWSEPSQ